MSKKSNRILTPHISAAIKHHLATSSNQSIQDFCFTINIPGELPLCVSTEGWGPKGRTAIVVAQLGKLNGDVMRDPGLYFEVVRTRPHIELDPFRLREDFCFTQQNYFSRQCVNGKHVVDEEQYDLQKMFARDWDAKLAEVLDDWISQPALVVGRKPRA